MTILAVITARKASKRLPSKNFRVFQGQSLTERAVAQGAVLRDEGLINDVVLSTDSAYLYSQCQQYSILDVGLREERLSGDSVKTVDVILNLLAHEPIGKKRYDAVLILQPTSPLRNEDDVRSAIEAFRASNSNSLITASAIPGATINGLYEKNNNLFLPISESGHNSGKRHQDLPQVYLRNGAVFLSKTELIQTGKIFDERPVIYEMPWERAIDVDSESDFLRAVEFSQKELPPKTHRTAYYSTKADLEEIREQAIRKRLFPIFPDVFRQWFSLQFSRMSPDIENWQDWCEHHVYFDGYAVLIDGEVVFTPKLLCACAFREHDTFTDRAFSPYLLEKTNLLAGGTDSVVLLPSNQE